ncbi:MAG: hypothetical protein GYA51_11865 [Candidatus Methanofastidiosa archaeon]|nr:hypothetical protein [Candidatus Methanofastidiosa archaeon]
MIKLTGAKNVRNLELKNPKLRNSENRIFRKGKSPTYEFKNGNIVNLVDLYSNARLGNARIIESRYRRFDNLEDVDLEFSCEGIFGAGQLINELKIERKDFISIITFIICP